MANAVCRKRYYVNPLRATILTQADDSTMLVASALFFPAISNAVPWSTDVRMNGIPRFTYALHSNHVRWLCPGRGITSTTSNLRDMVEHRVCRVRPGGVDAFGNRGFNSRSYLLRLGIADEVLSLACGFQCRNRNARQLS